MCGRLSLLSGPKRKKHCVNCETSYARMCYPRTLCLSVQLFARPTLPSSICLSNRIPVTVHYMMPPQPSHARVLALCSRPMRK